MDGGPGGIGGYSDAPLSPIAAVSGTAFADSLNSGIERPPAYTFVNRFLNGPCEAWVDDFQPSSGSSVDEVMKSITLLTSELQALPHTDADVPTLIALEEATTSNLASLTHCLARGVVAARPELAQPGPG